VASFHIEDPYKTLAIKTLKHYFKTQKTLEVPKELPKEMFEEKAGVFVSIKKNGHLRGCIGTIQATRKNIAAEIIQNTLSASFKDPRFPPIRKSELDNLSFSVDVLKKPEQVKNLSELDVNRYGVIVSHHHRRGLLLPNLQGIKTVDEQIQIALRKAGISSGEPYQIERFEVIRH
ncbi:MAG TPA: AmmeMemoRadiSam system protein A, partial [Candidatus Izemoplasmatales bacterium]|nr:AmmeMemoRadiSam system protein A [Candidatus Izemoplasmatales bacterium]